jgi:hypothetical protein
MLRVLAEGLAAQGHDVRVVLMFEPADDAAAAAGTAQTVGKLARLGIPFRRSEAGTVRLDHRGVTYSGVERASERFLAFALSEVQVSGRDAVILSDIGGSAAHVLLRVMHDRFDGAVIYFPMTVHMLPGGPLAVSIDHAAAAIVRKCRVVAPSNYAARYLVRHFGAQARVCIPPMFAAGAAGTGPPRDLRARFGKPIALFNPNTWKGLPVLLGLADARPNLRFLVRCGWRTTPADIRELRARRNILLDHQTVGTDGTIYESASVTLVPSLCHESLGLVPIESKLHGLPSLSSCLGGLAEAALGVPYSLPLNPIVFHQDPDQPEARAREEVPAQPLQPWLDALDEMSSNAGLYADLSAHGWRRAQEFARSLDWEKTTAAIIG